jgi:hypothetical protein
MQLYIRRHVPTKSMTESSSTARSYWHRARRCVRLAVGAPSQWEVPRVGTPAPEVQAAGVHRDRESSGAPTQAARQAARRGDVEQPRRCVGRRAGAHRRGEDSPPPPGEGNAPQNKASASCGRSSGVDVGAQAKGHRDRAKLVTAYQERLL